jgi:copper(I)-binding protein
MRQSIICAILAVCFGSAWAGPLDPIVSKAWIGESVPGQTSATLQMNVTTVKAVTLLSVTTPVAENVEIHSLMKHRGAMKVQVVNRLPLPEHSTSIFGSRGLFLMVTGIKQPLKSGERVPVNLLVSFADKKTKTIQAEAEVRQMELSYKHYGPNEVYDHR